MRCPQHSHVRGSGFAPRNATAEGSHEHDGLPLIDTLAMCLRRTQHLLRSTAGAFGTLAVGYTLMTVAPGLVTLLPAVIVRSLGAATLWVYSTLLLQYRVENRIQGE